ncbi:uncharacterized protein [Nicotiana tomentosiformis]|uniref:uncharacterized protein n=1 Tax=Nicotiana tomentosiformis TaxID=4098 RepID=UPI00388C55EC
MVAKIVKKVTGWHGKLLSVGGRTILIKHVLQSQPIHLLAAVEPPKQSSKRLKNTWQDSFGAQKMESRNTIGVLGLICVILMREDCASKVAKLSISTQSQLWRNMLRFREIVEDRMFWKINAGDSNLWWDNWTDMGAISRIILVGEIHGNQMVKNLINNGNWNIEHMHFPEFPTEHILTIPIGDQNCPDVPIWTPNVNGTFSTSSEPGTLVDRGKIDHLC